MPVVKLRCELANGGGRSGSACVYIVLLVHQNPRTFFHARVSRTRPLSMICLGVYAQNSWANNARAREAGSLPEQAHVRTAQSFSVSPLREGTSMWSKVRWWHSEQRPCRSKAATSRGSSGGIDSSDISVHSAAFGSGPGDRGVVRGERERWASRLWEVAQRGTDLLLASRYMVSGTSASSPCALDAHY
jgi:hypothetical protein